jgi:PAS domain S-box-containing protein
VPKTVAYPGKESWVTLGPPPPFGPSEPDAAANVRLLLEALPLAVVVADDAGRLALVNAHAARLFGYECDELLGRPVELLVPERYRGDHDGLRETFAGAPSARPMGVGRDLFGLRKDGREVPVEIGLNPIELPAGRFVVASIVDLTERKRVDDLHEAMAAIVESADDAIVTKTLDGIIRTWNPGAERLLGYAAAEIVGRPVTQLIPADRLEEEAEIIERIRRGEHVAHLETVRRAKDGTLLDVSLSVSPVRDGAGAVVGASKIMRDITERKHAEAMRLMNAGMRQRAAELQALNAELESFSYSVSHDLRAPVRAMLGFSEALLDDYGPGLDAEGRRLLNVVHDEAARMGALIDDLLSFSHLGRQPMDCAEVNMAELVRDVVAEQRSLAPDARATIEISPLPPALGDRALLRHVWANLISNALKYTGRCERPAIAIAGGVEGDRAVFSVRDNGAGFDMRYAGKLFGVFQRLHRSDEFPGTGVGLAIVARIVQRHGGSVRAEAAPGAGATFTITLPAVGSRFVAPTSSNQPG